MFSAGEIGISGFDCGAELGSTPPGVLRDGPHRLACFSVWRRGVASAVLSFSDLPIYNEPCLCMGDFSYFSVVVSL